MRKALILRGLKNRPTHALKIKHATRKMAQASAFEPHLESSSPERTKTEAKAYDVTASPITS